MFRQQLIRRVQSRLFPVPKLNPARPNSRAGQSVHGKRPKGVRRKRKGPRPRSSTDHSLLCVPAGLCANRVDLRGIFRLCFGMVLFRARPRPNEPCPPRSAFSPPTGPNWIHEIKHDGFRIMARREGSRVSLISGKGNDRSYPFPGMTCPFASRPVGSSVPDDFGPPSAATSWLLPLPDASRASRSAHNARHWPRVAPDESSRPVKVTGK